MNRADDGLNLLKGDESPPQNPRWMIRQDRRQRPGPESLGERAGDFSRAGWRQPPEIGHPRDLRRIGKMDDDRVMRRSALGFEDARDRGGIERVRAEAVDGFGGEGD